MKNTTITLDEATLEEARRSAAQMGCSFNAWVNKVIKEALGGTIEKQTKEVLAIADRAKGDSQGKSWTRDDMYER